MLKQTEIIDQPVEKFVVPEQEKKIPVIEILGKMSEVSMSKHGGRDARPRTRRQ